MQNRRSTRRKSPTTIKAQRGNESSSTSQGSDDQKECVNTSEESNEGVDTKARAKVRCDVWMKSRLDVPHRSADLVNLLLVHALANKTHGSKGKNFLGSGCSSLGRASSSASSDASGILLLQKLLELLTTARRLGTRAILVRTRTVGSQVGVVDGRDLRVLA
jgi:hypothetical protein